MFTYFNLINLINFIDFLTVAYIRRDSLKMM